MFPDVRETYIRSTLIQILFYSFCYLVLSPIETLYGGGGMVFKRVSSRLWRHGNTCRSPHPNRVHGNGNTGLHEVRIQSPLLNIIKRNWVFLSQFFKTLLILTYSSKCNTLTITVVIFFLRELKHKVKLPNVHARIAIHTGDIVTAVLGARHWKYDLLGDDVIRAKHLLERAHNG